MKINTITARAIKGRNFTIPLEAATIIAGANSTGKTAVLDAISLALLGFVPTLPKTNPGIFSLSSDKAMSVQIDTDEGQQIERAWSQGTNGTVNKSERVSGGGLPPMPAIMLDANEFFSKSEAGRMEMIFGLMNLAATPLKQRQSDLRAILADNAPAIAQLDKMPNIPGESFQRWLERAIAGMSEAVRIEAAKAKAMRATQQSLAHLQLKDESEAAPADLEAQLTAARTILEERRETKAKAEAELQGATNSAQRRSGLALKAGKLSTVVEGQEHVEKAIVLITAEIAEIQGIEDQKSLETYWKETTTAAIAEVTTREAATVAATRLREIEFERDEVLSHKECPTCFTNKPTWKRAATKRYDTLVSEAEEKAAVALAAHKEAEKAAAYARIQQKDAEHRSHRLEDLSGKLKNLTNELAACERAAESLAEVEKELESLPATEVDNPLAISHNADMEFEDAFNAVRALEDKMQLIANEKADLKRLAEAADAFDKATAAAAKIKQGVEVLIEARAHYMQDGITPLLTVANAFAQGILPSPLEFLNGEIGRTENNRWIPSRGFSGAEQAITHAAISAALGSQAPIRIVLFDELGRLDSKSKGRFMENVIAALSRDDSKNRLIDQFIGADVNELVYQEMNIHQNADLKIIQLKA